MGVFFRALNAGLIAVFLASTARAAESGRDTDAPRSARAGGVALSGLLGVTNSSYATDVRGLRLEGAMPLAQSSRFKIGGALGFEQHVLSYDASHVSSNSSVSGWFQHDAMHVGSAGVVLAVGAPWTNDVFGASVEGGLALGVLPSWANPADDPGSSFWRPKSSTFVSPYAQGALVAQLPLRGHFHPFVAASGRWIPFELGSSTLSAGAQVGLAFVAW